MTNINDPKDKKLNYSDSIYKKIIDDFALIKIKNVEFLIWTKIPDDFLKSYFTNEMQVVEDKLDYKKWIEQITNRPNPIYSVAMINRKVVSSIYSGLVYGNRFINLWYTNSDYRRQNIGKGVFLNLLKYIFDTNKEVEIQAWQVLSVNADKILSDYGFR